MNKLIIILVLMALIQANAIAEISYANLFKLKDAEEKLNRLEGFKAFVLFKHSNPNDIRPFDVHIVHEDQKIEIKVGPNGGFELPKLSEAFLENAVLKHSLETGALALETGFGFVASLPENFKSGVKLIDMVNNVIERYSKLDGVRGAITALEPETADLNISLSGFGFNNTNSVNGKIIIQKELSSGGKINVWEIDLMKLGYSKFTFDQFAPDKHWLVWNVEKEKTPPNIEWLFASGEKAKQVKNAISIWSEQKEQAKN